MSTTATTAINSATSYLAKINELGTFPTPGIDNDSQGFRDQWANIHGAITAVKDGVQYLDINTIKIDGETSFYGNTIKDVNLENSSVTLVELELQTGDITIDYSAGGYHAMSVTAGSHNLNVINWPTQYSGNAGHLTLVITTTDVLDTSINFVNDKFKSLDTTSTGAIYNLYPGSNMFELWSEESLTNRDPKYFVKQVGYNASTATNWNKIGSNTYSTGTNAETIVSSNGQVASVALIPNVVVKSYDIPPAFGTTAFKVDSTLGISVGALIYLDTTSTKYTVVSLNTVTGYVTPSADLLPTPSYNNQITFVNTGFTGQPLALNLTSTQPTSTASATKELRGQVYANSSTAFITFADANAGTVNKIQISGDSSGNPRSLGASTATTQPTATTSTLIATTEFVWNVVNSSTTVVAIAGTSSYATTATYAVTATYATTASTMVSGTNGFGTRTVSYNTPTGGVDGDIWYQII